jgi:gliding motility-associated-like protein
MKVKQFIILVSFLSWGVSSTPLGSCAMAQTPADSIVAPNVFTPNGDGENDFFELRSKDNNPVLLKIYTRAGVLVYSFEARLHAWDGCSLSGQPMAIGVYYYTAEVRGSSSKVSKSGFVHLYR